MVRKLIAFLGCQASGKGYNCNKLVTENGFTKLSFADALREMAFNIIGMDFEEGMKQYDELKKTELINGLNFRNILENLGSSIRKYKEDFWVDVVLNKVENSEGNICIDDMRYPNEFMKVYNFCQKQGIEFEAYYCCYRSENFVSDNPHESAALANYLFNLNYKDLQRIDINDILSYNKSNELVNLKEVLHKAIGRLKGEI